MAPKRSARNVTKQPKPQKDDGKKVGQEKNRTVRVQSDSPAAEAPQTASVIQKFGPGFPIVGIGASAGGLEALEELLRTMPVNTGMAFVVVTHQHPEHTSMLPELLQRKTRMRVVEAADGTKVEPNHVYVGSPGGHLAILEGALRRVETEKGEAPRLPIDYFFRSLANDQQERAICIVLSGTGTDGTLGVKAIKGESGMAMVQQPQSAKYAGMPSSAISTGLADYVSRPASMPEQLIAYARGPYLTGRAIPSEVPTVDAEPLQKILALLRSRTGNDFSAYKSNTIRRRIERRMNVHQIRKPEEYIRYLLENPHEIELLFKELLIGVTNFFRDGEAWEALGPYLENLVKSYPESNTLRAWVPGCSTGEEAYSLAILLQECMDKVHRHLIVQIFGTDLDAAAIETARVGRYPDGIAVDVSPRRLERYFTHKDGSYRIRKEIREMVIFAPQNVIKDPPFTRLNLLFCRNLLIYLNSNLQKKLLPIFHYALKPGGLMFLGPSETIASFTELFEPLDKRWKIFRREESAGAMRELPVIPLQRATGVESAPAVVAAPDLKEARAATQIQKVLLNRFVPSSVVVNERGDIFFIHGRTGAYLEPAPGEPRSNLFDMAREGLHAELPAAMRECFRTGADVTRTNILVKTNGEFNRVSLSVAKIKEPESVRGLLLVTFHPTPPVPPQRAQAKRNLKTAGGYERIKQLERDLEYMKESHRTTLEELETSNEELKSSNEELQSTNEELQSTNEELETSREEMQSLNEELTTVNTELQSKLDELSQTGNDMQNLLNSTDIATVFLDNDLKIKRFTDKATELIMLRQTDVGRPISDLTSNLEFDYLAAECRDVLKTLASKQNEVRTNDGRLYFKRIIPYRTAQNVINGVVLTFVNIGQLRARGYFSAIVDTVRQPLVVLDSRLRIISANRAFYHTFRTDTKQTEGMLIYELGTGQWDIPRLRQLLEEILPKDTKFDDYVVEADIPSLGHRVFVVNARRLHQPEDIGDLILMALEDTTNKERGTAINAEEIK